MMADADDYPEPAKRAYVDLKDAWEQTGSDFWRLGHSFDSVIDYLAMVDRSEASDFAEVVLTKYLEGGGAWYDDFAWWGIAGLRAAQRSDLFGWRSLDFRRFALDSWKTLDGNAPYGWDRADHAKFADYEPLFDGGVWNHVVDDGCNPSASSPDHLCGRQNTVTNALYLVLANRLSLDALVTTPAYLEAANREYAFLRKWFAFDRAHDSKRALLHVHLQGGGTRALVRERVSSFLSGNTDVAYQRDWYWTGDQGLILSALVDRMRMVPSGSPEYGQLLATARQVIAGTRDHLVDRDMDRRGILRSWRPDSVPGGDDKDYWTGIGVYMRSLLYAYQTNTELKNDLQQQDAQDFIRANAEYVAKHPDRSTSEDKVVNLTNNLATLVAAVGMLPPKSARH